MRASWFTWFMATAAWAPTVVATSAAAACTAIELAGRSDSSWQLNCVDGTSSTTTATFDPSLVSHFYIGNLDGAKLVPTASTRPTVVYMPTTLAHVGTLHSSQLTALSLTPEPGFSPPQPVTVSTAAFAQLQALESLELRDFTVANKGLQLILPRSIRTLALVDCGLTDLELTSAGSLTALTTIDLHSNSLTAIPTALFSLTSSLLTLDLRFNAFASGVTVTQSQAAALADWAAQGVLLINNVVTDASTCSTGQPQTIATQAGTSLTACVVADDTSADSNSRGPGRSHVAASSNNIDSSSSASTPQLRSVNVPGVVSGGSASGGGSNPSDASSTNRNQRPSAVLLSVTVSCGLACIIAIAYFLLLRRRRGSTTKSHRPPQEPNNSSLTKKPAVPQPTATSRFSLMRTSLQDDYAVMTGGKSCSSRSSFVMLTPSSASSSDKRLDRTQYATIQSPSHDPQSNLSVELESHAVAPEFVMSKSLQAFAGLTMLAPEKEAALRLSSRRKLRKFLEHIIAHKMPLDVYDSEYVCYGRVDESEHALEVKAYLARNALDKYTLKVFCEQDVKFAGKEYTALAAVQPTDDASALGCAVPLAYFDLKKDLDGVKCCVLVLAVRSQTTLLHVVRGDLDKSRECAVLQQLESVLGVLEQLHARQFVHGSLSLEHLVVDRDVLQLMHLEHATRFGEALNGFPAAAAEYLPPEMALRVLQDGVYDDTGDSISSSSSGGAGSVLKAAPAYDVWSFGVLALKIYANCKHLDEFRGCQEASEMLLRVADPSFSLDRSIDLYVLHAGVKELIRHCLQRDPQRRPSLVQLREHIISCRDGRCESLSNERVSFYRRSTIGAAAELTPPSIWFVLPPVDLEQDVPRSVDEWVSALSAASPSVLFPIVFLCESTATDGNACAAVETRASHVQVAVSSLPLVMPLVQEATLFLEAKAILANANSNSDRDNSDQNRPSAEAVRMSIAEISGFGAARWHELLKFYRALEKSLLAPVSSFTLMMLKPLEERLATGEPKQAQRVLTELDTLVFSGAKREHVLSLLQMIAATNGANAPRSSGPAWSGLVKCTREDASKTTTDIRWYCACHRTQPVPLTAQV